MTARELLKYGRIGYCSRCRRDNVVIVNNNVLDMTTECVDCYHERLKDLQEEKKRRADQVREYFARRSRYSTQEREEV